MGQNSKKQFFKLHFTKDFTYVNFNINDVNALRQIWVDQNIKSVNAKIATFIKAKEKLKFIKSNS